MPVSGLLGKGFLGIWVRKHRFFGARFHAKIPKPVFLQGALMVATRASLWGSDKGSFKVLCSCNGIELFGAVCMGLPHSS